MIAYWFTSARMARHAASLISSGASKSGKPWARLMASWRRARRVISRMTDSVNWSDLAETFDTDTSGEPLHGPHGPRGCQEAQTPWNGCTVEALSSDRAP